MKNEISIGVFVYNEEKNIPLLLKSLLNQDLEKIKIKEIIVVSSGSTDKTDKIVKNFSKKNKKVKLIRQEERKGKASAINEFLRKARSSIAVIESGDTIPKKDCIENLCKPFLQDEKIGMTGVRSIPTNDKNNFLGYVIHFWWWAHNELPRFGEMIAFRKKLCPQIDEKTAVDEAYIEAIITNKEYKKKQVPNAVINNHGAESIKDLIKQRKRVYIGHKILKKQKKYSVQSLNFAKMARIAARYVLKENSVKGFFYLAGGALIEIYSRLLGMYDYIKKENPYIWDISKSTKNIK